MAKLLKLTRDTLPSEVVGMMTELDYELAEVVNWDAENMLLWLSKDHGDGNATVEGFLFDETDFPRWYYTKD